MSISYKSIRTNLQWKASTGLSESQFHHLVILFGRAYEDLFGKSITARQSQSTTQSTFTNYEDLLFYCLYSIKSGLTYDLLALSFDISLSNAHANQSLSLRLLQCALELGEHMFVREYPTEAAFIEHWKNEAAVIVDATEQRVQRPSNEAEQKADYSGKKSTPPKVYGIFNTR